MTKINTIYSYYTVLFREQEKSLHVISYFCIFHRWLVEFVDMGPTDREPKDMENQLPTRR